MLSKHRARDRYVRKGGDDNQIFSKSTRNYFERGRCLPAMRIVGMPD